MIRVISKDDVEHLVTMPQVIDLLEKVFADYSEGKTVAPLRTKINVSKENGDILYMPAYLPETNALGCKIVSVYPENPNKGKPTIYSSLILNDAETGELVALMDAEHITALRTGAVSGLAAKYLSRKDSKIVSVFGAGVQARTQLQAIAAVRSIYKAYVFGRNEQRVAAFCEEMSGKLGIEVIHGKNQAECLAESDIIVAATTSSTPVFDATYIKEGCFISGVGAYTPEMQEIPPELLTKADIVVDAYGASLKEAGDLLIPMAQGLIQADDVKCELGDVVLGKFERTNDKQIIFFKSVGLAIQDICVAPLVYRMALEKGIGIDVTI